MSDRGDIPIGYCALEYRAPDDESVSPDSKNVILIVSRLADGDLSIRVHPDWRKTASADAHSILPALFDDLRERARRDPESLFRQLASLSVGVLQTYDFGQTLADRPDLLQLFDHFQEIKKELI